MSTQNNLGGSWHVGPDVPGKGINVVTEIGGHIVYVADLFGGTDGEQPDIARLIAAAPDLLAGLQKIVDKYDDGAHEAVLAAVARAAIAKATS
jgi:hypothetical protein